MRWAAVLLLALGACGSFREAWDLGDSVGAWFDSYFEVLGEETRGGEPDLRSEPGDIGHIAGAPSFGEQRHYYAVATRHTYVFASVEVADEMLEHQLVAEYPGRPPHRDGKLVVFPRPALLLVDAPRGWSVRAESEDGTSSTSMTGGDGARRFQLHGGRWIVRRENAFLWFDGKRRIVDLEPGGKTTIRLER